MHRIKVNLGPRSYDIVIGRDILNRLGQELLKLKAGTDAYIITNAWLKNKYGAKLTRALAGCGFNPHFKIVPDSEKSKSLEAAGLVIKDLAKWDKSRKVFIIAFGGGVVGDLAGFVASLYKRGVGYVQVPTTLLAQVDSSIGGKTAVDLDMGKNLVGAFYQPRLVFSEIDLLKSLDKKQLASGMAEVIKYAVIKDPGLFAFLENKYKDVLNKKPAALEKIVVSCSTIKAGIVSRDEKEAAGLRTLLNFGHTIGHAIEAAGEYKAYNHGQAVGLGMIAASDLSRRLGLTGPETVLRISDLVKSYGLPVKLKGVSLEKIVKAHYRDKKFIGKENKLVLIRGLGQTRILRNVPLNLIKKSIQDITLPL
ncbi:MAG: 3-dehydroquinate synthase [Candidatus Omnitrophica bacterium]|nr:3-dehydroquinate synthase [Candidatus Omnitrophota bacterium]